MFYSFISCDCPDAEAQDLTFDYAYGLLQQVYDASTKRKTNYVYDDEGKRYKKTIFKDDILLHDIETTCDVLGRPSIIKNTHLSPLPFYDVMRAQIKYDAVDNQRMFSVTLDPADYAMNQRSPQQQVDSWFTYDEADRVKMNAGQLINGSIQLSPGKGILFSYDKDTRNQETFIQTNGKKVNTALIFNADALLSKTIADTGMQTERIYQAQGWQVEWYGELYIPGDYYYKEDKLTRLINANGWCIRDEYVQIDRDKKNQHVLYRNTDYRLNNLGMIDFHQSWQQQDGYAVLYSYQHDYLKLDHWIETKVSGNYQTQDDGAGSAPSAQAFYDSNAVISGKINSADEINLPAPFPPSSIPNYFDHLKVHCDTDSDGWILNKEYYGPGSAERVYYPKGGYRTYLPLYNCTYAYLYDINGQVHGGYSFVTSNKENQKFINFFKN